MKRRDRSRRYRNSPTMRSGAWKRCAATRRGKCCRSERRSAGAVAVVENNLPAQRIFLQQEGEDSVGIAAARGGSLQMKISCGDGVIGIQYPDREMGKG